MKHLVSSFLIIFSLTINSFAQKEVGLFDSPPKAYLSIGLGINHTGIISIGAEVPVAEQISVFGDLGVGGWGLKYGLGGTYHFNDIQRGSAISLGIYGASGSGDNAIEAMNDFGEFIPITLNSTATLNINYSISFRLGKKSKFALISGYAIALADKEKAYDIQLPTGSNILIDDFTRSFMGLLHPDGLTLGAKFLIGLGSK